MKYKVKNKVPQGGEVNKDFEGSGFLATGFRRQGVTQKKVRGKGNPMSGGSFHFIRNNKMTKTST